LNYARIRFPLLSRDRAIRQAAWQASTLDPVPRRTEEGKAMMAA
jgi:hypothetical protein